MIFMELTVKEYRKHTPYQYLNPFGKEGSSPPGKAGNVYYNDGTTIRPSLFAGFIF